MKIFWRVSRSASSSGAPRPSQVAAGVRYRPAPPAFAPPSSSSAPPPFPLHASYPPAVSPRRQHAEHRRLWRAPIAPRQPSLFALDYNVYNRSDADVSIASPGGSRQRLPAAGQSSHCALLDENSNASPRSAAMVQRATGGGTQQQQQAHDVQQQQQQHRQQAHARAAAARAAEHGDAPRDVPKAVLRISENSAFRPIQPAPMIRSHGERVPQPMAAAQEHQSPLLADDEPIYVRPNQVTKHASAAAHASHGEQQQHSAAVASPPQHSKGALKFGTCYLAEQHSPQPAMEHKTVHVTSQPADVAGAPMRGPFRPELSAATGSYSPQRRAYHQPPTMAQQQQQPLQAQPAPQHTVPAAQGAGSGSGGERATAAARLDCAMRALNATIDDSKETLTGLRHGSRRSAHQHQPRRTLTAPVALPQQQQVQAAAASPSPVLQPARQSPAAVPKIELADKDKEQATADEGGAPAPAGGSVQRAVRQFENLPDVVPQHRPTRSILRMLPPQPDESNLERWRARKRSLEAAGRRQAIPMTGITGKTYVPLQRSATSAVDAAPPQQRHQQQPRSAGPTAKGRPHFDYAEDAAVPADHKHPPPVLIAETAGRPVMHHQGVSPLRAYQLSVGPTPARAAHVQPALHHSLPRKAPSTQMSLTNGHVGAERYFDAHGGPADGRPSVTVECACALVQTDEATSELEDKTKKPTKVLKFKAKPKVETAAEVETGVDVTASLLPSDNVQDKPPPGPAHATQPSASAGPPSRQAVAGSCSERDEERESSPSLLSVASKMQLFESVVAEQEERRARHDVRRLSASPGRGGARHSVSPAAARKHTPPIFRSQTLSAVGPPPSEVHSSPLFQRRSIAVAEATGSSTTTTDTDGAGDAAAATAAVKFRPTVRAGRSSASSLHAPSSSPALPPSPKLLRKVVAPPPAVVEDEAEEEEGFDDTAMSTRQKTKLWESKLEQRRAQRDRYKTQPVTQEEMAKAHALRLSMKGEPIISRPVVEPGRPLAKAKRIVHLQPAADESKEQAEAPAADVPLPVGEPAGACVKAEQPAEQAALAAESPPPPSPARADSKRRAPRTPVLKARAVFTVPVPAASRQADGGASATSEEETESIG